MYIYVYIHILFSRERHLLRAFCLLDTVLTAENLAVKNQADTTKFIVVKPDIAGWRELNKNALINEFCGEKQCCKGSRECPLNYCVWKNYKDLKE